MCEIHETAETLGKSALERLLDDAAQRVWDVNAIADSLRCAADCHCVNPTLDESAPSRIAEIISREVCAIADILDQADRESRDQAAVVRTLETQLKEIADARELLRKRDRPREILARRPSKDGLHNLLKPDDTTGGSCD